ncbi:hypothetical protein EVAR_79328_1 [Eumeta japonica]|uniref:Uncharacterized protein n=1 Tax=Eumeta variegata TaxID=151549 RepID=A0A4C1TFW6_EUMVA|nr:hypothetical protein EVAR_79328_1 [Eumeta japonica]
MMTFKGTVAYGVVLFDHASKLWDQRRAIRLFRPEHNSVYTTDSTFLDLVLGPQYEKVSAPMVRCLTFTEYKREVTASTVTLRPVSETSESQFLPPLRHSPSINAFSLINTLSLDQILYTNPRGRQRIDDSSTWKRVSMGGVDHIFSGYVLRGALPLPWLGLRDLPHAISSCLNRRNTKRQTNIKKPDKCKLDTSPEATSHFELSFTRGFGKRISCGMVGKMMDCVFSDQDFFITAEFRCRCGTEDLLLPHARASSRRGHDPDGSSGNGPYLVDPLIDILPEPSRRPTRGRARSLRRRRQVVGGSGVSWCSTRGGREAQLKLDTQPTAGGQTLPLSWCRSGAYAGPPRARASRACAQRLVGAPGCEDVVSEGGREARNRPHTQPTAGGRTLVDADRIKAARIGDPRWRRSNRARLPTADQAIHASDGGR